MRPPHALDLIGERRALLVPKHFTDLPASARTSSPGDWRRSSRRTSSATASSWVYELTAWGFDLEPVMMALAAGPSARPR
jgi:hypothetical protein